jgi:hypothetical protein
MISEVAPTPSRKDSYNETEFAEQQRPQQSAHSPRSKHETRVGGGRCLRPARVVVPEELRSSRLAVASAHTEILTVRLANAVTDF